MLDPIITPVMLILGKYVLDKGVELGKEVGPKALETAREMFQLTLDHLRQTPRGEVLAEGYEEEGEVYEKPVQKELDKVVQENASLKAELQQLLTRFEEQSQAPVPASVVHYNATVTGGGAIAQGDGTTAVGQGGVIISGSTSGNIITGSGNTINYGSVTPRGEKRPAHRYMKAPVELLSMMTDYLSLDDVRNICYTLGLDYENLGGAIKSGNVRELLILCEREHLVPTLIDACREVRPQADWPTV